MLSVLNVAYPFAPVGTDAAGGAEQIVAALDAALVEAGHRSLILARQGSKVRGELVELEVPSGPLTAELRRHVTKGLRLRLEALLGTRAIHLVHLHGVDCASYLPAACAPVVVTLHLPGDWYDSSLFVREPQPQFVCVSQAQRALLQRHISVGTVIENGVDLRAYRPEPERRGGYVVCLGRICPEKGFHQALRAALAHDLPLYLAGEVFPYPEHVRYFEQEILPLLDEKRRYLGPVAGEFKRQLLAGADCLLVPSLVPETSSLVVMEAMACGTPAIVSAAGALPSLVEAGVTGWVVHGDYGWSDALARRANLSRDQARASAERRFAADRMTEAYLALYTRIAESWTSPGRKSTAGQA